MGPEAMKAEDSLNNIQRVCKLLRIVMSIIFVVLCIFWLISTGSMIFSFLNVGPGSHADNIGPLNIILSFAYGGIIAVMYFIFISMFSDVLRGESPFTLAQVKRLRLIAGTLVVYALLDFIGACNNALFQIHTLNSGYISTSDSAIVMINFTPLLAAAVVFAFSFIFKYGVLLQEFSDDTL